MCDSCEAMIWHRSTLTLRRENENLREVCEQALAALPDRVFAESVEQRGLIVLLTNAIQRNRKTDRWNRIFVTLSNAIGHSDHDYPVAACLRTLGISLLERPGKERLDQSRKTIAKWVTELEKLNLLAFGARYAHNDAAMAELGDAEPTFNAEPDHAIRAMSYSPVELLKALRGVGYNLDEFEEESGIQEFTAALAIAIASQGAEYERADTW